MKTHFVRINDESHPRLHAQTWRCIQHHNGTISICDIDMPVGKKATGRIAKAKKSGKAQLVSKAEWASDVSKRRKKKPVNPGKETGQIGKKK